MFTIRLRIAAVLLLTIIILAVWGALIPRGAHSEAAPTLAAAKAPKELLEKRFAEVKTIWDIKWNTFKRAKRWPPLDLLGWSERLLEAELALYDDKEQRAKALKAHVERTRELEYVTIVLAKLGSAGDLDIRFVTYDRLNAEIRYCEDTGRPLPPPPTSKSDVPKSPKKGEQLPKRKRDDRP